jgi:hypothetical protein
MTCITQCEGCGNMAECVECCDADGHVFFYCIDGGCYHEWLAGGDEDDSGGFSDPELPEIWRPGMP